MELKLYASSSEITLPPGKPIMAAVTELLNTNVELAGDFTDSIKLTPLLKETAEGLEVFCDSPDLEAPMRVGTIKPVYNSPQAAAALHEAFWLNKTPELPKDLGGFRATMLSAIKSESDLGNVLWLHQCFKALTLAEPHITGYKEDLEIDAKVLVAAAPYRPRFLHYARMNGSHLVLLPPAETYPAAGETTQYLFGTVTRDGLLKKKLEEHNAIVSTYSKELKLIQYHNGNHLVMRVNSSLGKLLIILYTKIITNTWRNQHGTGSKAEQ